MSAAGTRDFRVDIPTLDDLLRRALSLTYATRDTFGNESDFKLELFHNLHGLRLSGFELGSKLPGHPTCLIHAEARAVNGNPRKADILVCNPSAPKPMFNYKTEVVIELKETLNADGFRKEVEKFKSYGDDGIHRLYVIPANRNTLTYDQETSIRVEHELTEGSVLVYDRSLIPRLRRKREDRDCPGLPLVKPVSACIEEALRIYGENRQQYHGFFWCNYEHEQSKGWTFPAEGDFNAQLYHLLRTRLPNRTMIHTEYKLARNRSDIFITRSGESIAVEVKMNWDQFRLQPNKKQQEVASILQKFDHLGAGQASHTNILVVIQGEDGHRTNNKRTALRDLGAGGVPFDLFYYDERIDLTRKERLKP